MTCLLILSIPLLFLTSVNTLILGETQQGKSTLCLNEDIIPTIESRSPNGSRSSAVFIFDPHDTMAEKVGLYCAVRPSLAKRLVMDRLDDLEHVASFGLLSRSESPDAKVRAFEHQMIADDFLDILAARRKDYDIRSAPNTLKYTQAALDAWLENDHDIPLVLLPEVLSPPLDRKQKSSPYHWILSGVRNPVTRRDLQALETMSDKLRMDEAGGALRLLSETWRDIPLRNRMSPNLDLGRFIAEKGIYCLQGGRASDNSKSTVMRLVGMMVMRRVMNTFFLDRAIRPVKVYCDEAANFHLIGLPEARALGQTTKMGLTYTIISQAYFNDPEVTKNVNQNTPRKIALKSSSPTSREIADNMRSNLRTDVEHYREKVTKQRHAGVHYEDRVSKRTDADGKDAGKVINAAAVPIYEDVVEERVYYLPINSQDMLNESAVQQLTRGRCLILSDGQVFSHTFADWRDPGEIPGYAERKLRRHIESLRASGVLRPPVEIDYDQWMPPIPSVPRAPWSRGAGGMS